EKLAVECIREAIPVKDFYILVVCNVLQGFISNWTSRRSNVRTLMEMAIEFAIESGDYELMIYSSSKYLVYLKMESLFSEALEEEKRILILLKRVSPSLITIQALRAIASLQLHLTKYDKVVKYLLQALEDAGVISILNEQLTIINNLSSVYITVKEYTKSEEILQKGLEIAKELEAPYQIILILFNLGILKVKTEKFAEAIEYFDQCMTIVDEADSPSSYMLIDIYNNYSMCYNVLGEQEKALEYIDKAVNITIRDGLLQDQIQIEVNKTNILINIGRYEEAKEIFLKAIAYYKKAKNLHQMIWVYRALANLYAKQGDFKTSYETLFKVNKISDDYIIQIQNEQVEKESETKDKTLLEIDRHISQKNIIIGSTQGSTKSFVGCSKAWQNVMNSALLAAQHPNASVMITGESGTGKEVIAQMIHNNSVRRRNSFIPVNIGALSATLIESELFGHAKGAFTGAIMPTKGYFLQADKGTLFLDEITEMPLELQSKLLRVIETRNVTSVGSTKEISFDCRILTATNRDLREQVDSNKFRLDLFHRLNTIEILIPPLRERQEDIEPLILYYLEFFSSELKKPKPILDNSFIDKMAQYSFPGNVRELKNIMERMYILSKVRVWDEPLLCEINNFLFTAPSNDLSQIQSEADMIIKALIKAKGKQKEAAILLGMSEATLHRRILKHNLQEHTRKGK
ncbi:MAG: sigma 54-interacting transcriptional regulator, partial [Candidatus Cloacimonetes bacterium]|nr:sigma 54-interacting transcriptional regulator [Candidatus Cloacimonadota bacterium]